MNYKKEKLTQQVLNFSSYLGLMNFVKREVKSEVKSEIKIEAKSEVKSEVKSVVK